MKKNNLNLKSRLEAIGKAILTNLEAVDEIAVRNELPFFDVFGIYYEFYKRDIKESGEIRSYVPVLQEKTYRLTERYFDMQRKREYIKNKSEID